MKKGFKLLVTMLLAMLIAMSSVMPAFAQAEETVALCSDDGAVPRNSNYIYEYKYDENGRLMYRIWDDFKQLYITDWMYWDN